MRGSELAAVFVLLAFGAVVDFAVGFLVAGGFFFVLFATRVFDGEDDFDFDVLDLAGV